MSDPGSDRRPRPLWIYLGLGVAAALVLGLGLSWRHQAREAERVEARRREERREVRRRRAEGRWALLREQSVDVVPDPLAGVALGMTLEEVTRVRPGLAPPARANAGEPGLYLREETLDNGARVVLVFDADSDRLQRIQVLSQLPEAAAITPHLTAMNERYGPPSGAWHCPDTGGVPTRRFTWRLGEITVADVFLIYRGRVSVTLYIAPHPVAARSLRMAGCRRLLREELETFPVATPEQMGADPSGRLQ